MIPLVAPKRVFLLCARSYDWLYPLLIREMRERYGTTFVLLIPDDRVSEFADVCSPADFVMPLSKFGPTKIGPDRNDPAATFDRARRYEEKYDLSYMRDIVQQDRVVSANFLNTAPNAGLEQYGAISLQDIAAFINSCFAFHESFLEEQGIDLVISRAGGLSETVMIEIASHRKIPVTFLHGSYYGRRAQWAAGPYLSPRVVMRRFDETPAASPVARSEIAPGGWDAPKMPSLRSLLIDLLKTVVIYGQFALQDFRRGRRARRTALSNKLRSMVRQFEVKRYLHRTGESDIEKLSARPFVYVALPDEPEFTVQSMCREFGDSRAWFRQLALSLPMGVTAVLKEHQRIGSRSREFYEDLLRFPNVMLAHHALRGVDLIARCAATVTMGGSTPAEAAQFGKRSVVFGPRNPYSFLPNVHVVTNPTELAETLRYVLRPQTAEEIEVNQRAGARFRGAVQSLSFDALGTPLFFGGTRTEIESAEVKKAVDALIYCTSVQHDDFAKSSDKSFGRPAMNLA